MMKMKFFVLLIFCSKIGIVCGMLFCAYEQAPMVNDVIRESVYCLFEPHEYYAQRREAPFVRFYLSGLICEKSEQPVRDASEVLVTEQEADDECLHELNHFDSDLERRAFFLVMRDDPKRIGELVIMRNAIDAMIQELGMVCVKKKLAYCQNRLFQKRLLLIKKQNDHEFLVQQLIKKIEMSTTMEAMSGILDVVQELKQVAEDDRVMEKFKEKLATARSES